MTAETLARNDIEVGTQLRFLRLGITGMVQFIGGEPTSHPDLPMLERHAVTRGIEVEVFSNRVRVTDELWETFGIPGVRLATSYYSNDAAEHQVITGRRGNVRDTRLHPVVVGSAFAGVRAELIREFGDRNMSQGPVACHPQNDGNPCVPKNRNPACSP